MAQQLINLGTTPNDGTGDTLRDGGDKINANFTEVYGLVGGAGSNVIAAFNVLNFGVNVGTGNAAVDTQAFIDAAAAAANTSANSVVYVPGGKNYHINQTIAWPPGIHMIGGAGAAGINGRAPQVRWDGAAGGTMFTCIQTGDRVINTLISQVYFRELNSGAKPATAWEFGSSSTNPVSGIDFLTEFHRCPFSGFTGDCLKYMYGPTNLHIYNCRWDAINGYCIYVRTNNQTIFSLDKFTIDMVGGGKGLVHFDGAGAGSNKYVVAHISNGRIEVNAQPTDQKAIILCTIDSSASQLMMHFLTGHNLWFANAVGITDWACFKPIKTAGGTTDAIMVEIQGLYKGNGRIMDNTVTAVPNPSWPQLPWFRFAPSNRSGLTVVGTSI